MKDRYDFIGFDFGVVGLYNMTMRVGAICLLDYFVLLLFFGFFPFLSLIYFFGGDGIGWVEILDVATSDHVRDIYAHQGNPASCILSEG